MQCISCAKYLGNILENCRTIIRASGPGLSSQVLPSLYDRDTLSNISQQYDHLIGVQLGNSNIHLRSEKVISQTGMQRRSSFKRTCFIVEHLSRCYWVLTNSCSSQTQQIPRAGAGKYGYHRTISGRAKHSQGMVGQQFKICLTRLERLQRPVIKMLRDICTLFENDFM